MRFPLNQQIIGGYRFGVPTSYSSFHLGVDYRCYYADLFAPEDGKIVYNGVGKQGGLTIHYLGNSGKLYRFLHLSFYMPKSNYREGNIIGKTGNSGVSSGPHLHSDIWKNGKVDWNLKNLIDPEQWFSGSNLAPESPGEGDKMTWEESHREAVKQALASIRADEKPDRYGDKEIDYWYRYSVEHQNGDIIKTRKTLLGEKIKNSPTADCSWIADKLKTAKEKARDITNL